MCSFSTVLRITVTKACYCQLSKSRQTSPNHLKVSGHCPKSVVTFLTKRWTQQQVISRLSELSSTIWGQLSVLVSHCRSEIATMNSIQKPCWTKTNVIIKQPHFDQDYLKHLPLPTAPALPLFKPKAYVSTQKPDLGSLDCFIYCSPQCHYS